MNRLLVLPVVSLLLLSCASGAAKKDDTKKKIDDEANGPRYTAEPGSKPVGVIPAGSLHDPKRNKDIELSIDYPTRGGPDPIIIFSHGLGSSPRDYTSLASYWASHGYVVIRPAHSDARRVGTSNPDSEQLERQGPPDWRNRTQDITFIIDSLGTLEQQYPELAGKMNHDQIGVGGYSFGAFTTMLIGGARTYLMGNDTPLTYRDARVKAALALSPQGPAERRGLTRQSWSEVKLPIMYMTGSADIGSKPEENAEWRQQAFDLSPAGDKWFVLVQGAGHMTFAGRSSTPVDVPDPRDVYNPNPNIPSNDPRYPNTQPGQGQIRPRGGSAAFDRDRTLFRAVQSISLAFWDTYLKSDKAGRDYLNKLSTRGDLQVKTK